MHLESIEYFPNKRVPDIVGESYFKEKELSFCGRRPYG